MSSVFSKEALWCDPSVYFLPWTYLYWIEVSYDFHYFFIQRLLEIGKNIILLCYFLKPNCVSATAISPFFSILEPLKSMP